MNTRLLSLAALLLFAASAPGTGFAKPAGPPDKPAGAEVAFVQSIQKDLLARFPKAADAQRAGFVRFTNEDRSGSISYANFRWQSPDPKHPSQLWYDVNGNLLGADFSQLIGEKTTASPPHLWGIDPRRWEEIPAHVHYILKNPDGTLKYGGLGLKKFAAAGGSATDPQIATLVKMHIAKNATDVMRVFLFPHEWDLVVWVKANPKGAFAEMNPLVHRSVKGSGGM